MNRRTPATTQSREAIKSSAEFRAFVEETLTNAERRRADAQLSIDLKNQEISRALADYHTTKEAIEREIVALMGEKDDAQQIIDAASIALQHQIQSHEPTDEPT